MQGCSRETVNWIGEDLPILVCKWNIKTHRDRGKTFWSFKIYKAFIRAVMTYATETKADTTIEKQVSERNKTK